MLPVTKLFVFPNPYRSFDHEGRPNHLVPWDPDHNPGRGFVGAQLCAIVHTKDAHGFSIHQDTFAEYEIETPIELPNTKYYEHELRDGNLIPADKKTALVAGRPFVDPAQVLADSKAALLAKFKAHHPDEEDEPKLAVNAIGTHADKLAKAKADAKANPPPAAAEATPTPTTSGTFSAPTSDEPKDMTPTAVKASASATLHEDGSITVHSAEGITVSTLDAPATPLALADEHASATTTARPALVSLAQPLPTPEQPVDATHGGDK